MSSEVKATEVFQGSGNVFADLESEGSGKLYTRAQIRFQVFGILEEKGLKQKAITELLEIKQWEVSHLMNGYFDRFTTDRLLVFLQRLDWKVTIQISPHKSNEPYRAVVLTR
ncbi:helix-turn-helix domain-containing protein [Synechococcus sp. PCC 7336]|uniref:helix-turn-helix domain-containing protein n=1 Tax=Synechococcus sp. PCC 7336 TaxID=195250 RepID=UPI00034BCADE|nr:XRE family transcriptional regulator [Synechococcus sp. PCC 7336]